MNVFFIPSWYPSDTHPLPGIFFRDQALALGQHFPDMKVGISLWGQNDERMLLWAGHPLENLRKICSKSSIKEEIINIGPNVEEYFFPAFTWTDRLFQGNIRNIIRANMTNLRKFETRYGKVDIIHAHVGHPAGYIAKILSETQRVPYVITEQMSPFPYPALTKNQAQRLTEAFRESEKNIAISQAQAGSMAAYGIEKIVVIPNLVDDTFFHTSLHAAPGRPFTFFSLGRMVPQKGIDILLRAFAELAHEANLRIGGDGEAIMEYKQLAAQLGIEEKVLWLGELTRKEAASEYQQCHAFILPSRHESMGLVFAEAMACGRPVIATRCGGPEEFIDDSCGMIVEPEDINGLAAAMEKMISSREKYSEITIRESCRGRFSPAVISQKIMDAYLRVATKKNFESFG